MIFTTVDSIVRRMLLEKSYPIHWYAEYLFHTSTCLRQLTTDTLKIINAKNLPVNSYLSVDLPADFVDDIALTIPVGELLQNVPKKDNLNPLRVHDTTTGQFAAYPDLSPTGNNSLFGFIGNWYWFWNISDYGEPTGRYYGAGGGERLNGYKVIKEQRRIQLTGTFTSDDVVLLYISDGQDIDTASQIDTLAIDAIKAYINWMCSPSAGIDASPEGMSYYNQRRILRGRLDDLTVTDIKEILHKNYLATVKN